MSAWLLLIALTLLGALAGNRIMLRYLKRRQTDRLDEMRRAVREELDRRQ